MDNEPWPIDSAGLEAKQRTLARAADATEPWSWPGTAPHGGAVLKGEAATGAVTRTRPAAGRAVRGHPATGLDRLTPAAGLSVATAFAAFPRGEGGPGRAGQPVVVVAIMWRGGRAVDSHVFEGPSGGPYAAGYLALRCGALLEAAIRGLEQRPDVVLVDATGRDHPRRAGLALHLGARLDVPSVGVTNRVLVAEFDEPGLERGAVAPLRIAGDLVGYAVRTRAGARPVLAHAAWRTTPEQARDLVLALGGRWRTPLPLRAARTLARLGRGCEGRGCEGRD